MRKFNIADRIRYRFDAYMAKGTIALVGGLAVLTLLLIIAAGAFLAAFGIAQEGGEPLPFFEAVWAGFMHTLDSGAIGADSGWAFRIVMLAVTIGGIFILSTLISVLSSGLESRLDALRRGRSVLVERGHTVILGYSGQVFPILEQLVLANESERGSCVAILAEGDKTAMEDEIRERLRDSGRTRIIVRSGSPTCVEDLGIVNLGEAKSIIVLADGDDEPDNRTIKTLLAILKEQRSSGGKAPIVAEIVEEVNVEPARIAAEEGASIVKVNEVVSRIIAQCCRQSGLSAAYLELLDFEGNEIYFRDNPDLRSMTFRDALFLYSDEAAMGIYRQDGKAELNPPMDARFGGGDRLIVLAEDDKPSYRKGKERIVPNEASIVREEGGSSHGAVSERTLILAWNGRVPLIARELEGYAANGSAITIASSDPQAAESVKALGSALSRQTLEFREGDTTSRSFLESLSPGTYDRVVVMSPADADTLEKADSRSLVTLLHLRDMARKAGKDVSIVSEIMDIRNRELAEAAEADDFIVSDRILSLMTAMLSENPGLESVFEDLLDSGGSELYLKPASLYVRKGAAASFATVVEAAARRGETAVGYSLFRHRRDSEKAFGVVLNPAKAGVSTFEEGDRIIVLAAN